jgi:hypothetical protein
MQIRYDFAMRFSTFICACDLPSPHPYELTPLLPLLFVRGSVELQGTEQTKQTPWPLVCKRTIPTERPPLVGEI